MGQGQTREELRDAVQNELGAYFVSALPPSSASQDINQSSSCTALVREPYQGVAMLINRVLLQKVTALHKKSSKSPLNAHNRLFSSVSNLLPLFEEAMLTSYSFS